MNFYILDQFPRGNADTVMHCPPRHNQGDAPMCPSCGGFVGSLTWLPPFQVELEVFGREFGDVVFGAGDDFIISQRFKDLYFEEGRCGLSGFEPVEVTAVKARRRAMPPVPNYFRVGATRNGAVIDTEASAFEWLAPPTCAVCKSANIIRWKRMVFESKSWGGEDIFYADGLTGTLFTSERFKEFRDRHHIKNAILIPAELYSHDFYPGLKDPSELEKFNND